MRTLILLLASLVYGGVLAGTAIHADYQYEKQIGSYWSLSEKASTLQKKSEYLDAFVAALKDAHLSGNNALFLATPDNSYSQNMLALESLQNRMHEIQQMDVKSFEYQQAISQITAQEQGEAVRMLDIFEGIWYLDHHLLLWSWVGFLNGLFLAAGLVAAVISAICES